MNQEEYKIGKFGPDLGLKLNRNRIVVDDRLDSLDTSTAKGLRYQSGLEATYASTTDITVAAGSIMDSTNTVLLTLPSAMTKELDNVWSAGSAAGGRASALTLAEEAYKLFIIKLANGSIDLGWDTSETATNLIADSGATHYRRFDYTVTLSTPFNIRNYILEGPTTRTWVTGSTEWNGAPTVAGALVTTVTPPNQVGVYLNGLQSGSTTISNVLVNSVAIPSLAPALENGMLAIDSSGAENAYIFEKKRIETNSARQVRQRSNNTSCNLRLISLGWNNNIEVA